MSVVEATERALAVAEHVTDQDAGAVAALMALARKIDAWDEVVQYALDDAAGKAQGTRPAVPQNDNVSLSAYLKYCDQLGLSPAGRIRFAEKPKEGPRGKLSLLQDGAGKKKRTA